VRAAVVEDQMQIQPGRCRSLDLAQKIQEFLGPVALGHPPDDFAGDHIEGGVQTGGATTSTTFSANCGSWLILNVLSRWGLRSAACQICWTCQRLMRACSAIKLTLKCVASLGIRSTVVFKTQSIFF
jgi:hypothetical protein